MSDPDGIVRPETPLERAICADPAWRAGVAWGEPRSGHPEGTVIAHVGDVLANVDRVALGAADRERLRLAALVHDAFKGDVDRSLPKTGENHHAMRARRFAERHLDDPDLLDVIELHDDAYLAWRHGRRSGDWDGAERRARALIGRLDGDSGERFALYLRFYRADNETDGKTDEHRHWFAGCATVCGSRPPGSRWSPPRRALRALPPATPRRAEGPARRGDPGGLAGLGPRRDPARSCSSGFWPTRRRWATAYGSSSLRDPRIVVGSAGFIAPPDDGTIELGYGIHADHRGAGYATEAATALVAWAWPVPASAG